MVWEVAGPAIARALVDRDFRLSRRHATAFRSTTEENLERVRATTQPTYTSEWLAGSSLLLTLARYLPPLSHHNLAQETLTMTAPTGGSLRKVSGAAVTSILMMADALEAMLEDVGTSTKRPKRLSSIVENSITLTFQTLFPLDYLESEVESSASGFDIEEEEGDDHKNNDADVEEEECSDESYIQLSFVLITIRIAVSCNALIGALSSSAVSCEKQVRGLRGTAPLPCQILL